jgi:hypothetical protein
MKLVSVLIACALWLAGAAASLAQDKGDNKVLLGPVAIEQLIDLPDWFGKDYLSYMPASIYTDEIPAAMRDVEIVCVLGTWCSDSRREVPRLIRVLQVKNIDPAKLKIFGADRNKMTPGGESAVYQVEKVPTFVFLRNGAEIGRIVETTSHSMERDMLAILRPESESLKLRKQLAPLPPLVQPPPPEPPPPPKPTDEAASPDGAVK